MNINSYIDHTLLMPTATTSDIKQICNEAIQYKFYAVCIHPYWVNFVNSELKNTNVKIAAVIGFPLGVSTTANKVAEAKEAVKNGADEIDMVINHVQLAEKQYDVLAAEIKQIKQSIGNAVLKVIIETCYLTNAQIIKASELCVQAGANFVKTSTGFGTGGATIEHIKLMKEAVNGQAQLKASGGVRDYDTAKLYIDLGVSRLGTSSGVAIMKGEKSDSEY